MTVIAWDGATLAADRMVADNWTIRERTKVCRIRGHLVGAAGESDHCAEAVAWFTSGAVPAEFPQTLRLDGPPASLLVITPQHEALLFQRSPWPTRLEGQWQAIGSGAEAALVAMSMGAGAASAVAACSRFCRGVGCGVDTLTFAE